jgi:hypothetical protein
LASQENFLSLSGQASSCSPSKSSPDAEHTAACSYTRCVLSRQSTHLATGGVNAGDLRLGTHDAPCVPINGTASWK